MNKKTAYLLSAYAIGVVIAGMVYLYAGLLAPIEFSPEITKQTSSLVAYFASLQPAWIYYSVAFVLFIVVDFILIAIGVFLARLFREHETESLWILICFTLGGLLSFAIDLITFGQWQVIGMYQAQMSSSSLPALWSVFLVIQTIGMWGSIFWFVLMALGVYFVYRITKTRQGFSKPWFGFCFLFIILLLLCAGALTLTLFTAIKMPALILFLITNLLVAPAWCLWFARNIL